MSAPRSPGSTSRKETHLYLSLKSCGAGTLWGVQIQTSREKKQASMQTQHLSASLKILPVVLLTWIVH